MSAEPRLLEVRKNVLKQNDVLARGLRERFRAQGTFVVSLVSSPGAGKTAFLEKTLTLLRPQYRIAALVGDLATENDSVRLARSQAPVKQITTGTICHLDAAMIENGTSGSWISCSSKMWAIWFVLPPTIWERIFGLSCFR
jgi:hydrogenase nickel incorporation protein HypB